MADLGHQLGQLLDAIEESEYVEFKHNNEDPDAIGQLISGIANTAALRKSDRGFIVWGVQDNSKEFVGTSFQPNRKKVGNEELENWLSTLLEPRVHFQIHEFSYAEKRAVIFEISPASYRPVAFKGREWIRIGTYNKPLREHPEREKRLWNVFRNESFETETAAEGFTHEMVLRSLDCDAYFRLLEVPVPPGDDGILEHLEGDLLVRNTSRGYEITNLGAVLFANHLADFQGLANKAVRLSVYKGDNKVEFGNQIQGVRGYASGFEKLVNYISGQLPESVEIKNALRVAVPTYPAVAIRELVANALIHQDFGIPGSWPRVEIFAGRIEITNPGEPLKALDRIDLAPQSRNEKLSSLMRRLRICEEQGSGIQRVFTSAELWQLPAPEFVVASNHTKVVLSSPKKFSLMTPKERIRACYQHAILRYVSQTPMTNSSLRKRFALSEKSRASASVVIQDAIKAGFIKPFDPASRSRKYASYVPSWA
jgi:predicted HTH transcriptional regulator